MTERSSTSRHAAADSGLPASESFMLLRARLQILHQVERALDIPMAVLGLVWLALMVVDLVYGLGRAGGFVTTSIWVAFVADFLLRFTLAPKKIRFLRKNWLSAIALLLPALRIARFARVFRALARLRGLQLVRIAASVNRGMKSLGKTMRRRGFGYVLGLTAMVTVAGAAGMLFFERNVPGSALDGFWSALWWTAMIVTTMGSESWPKTAEGRALCLFLAVYAFAVFGYVTGTIATYFIGRDVEEGEMDLAMRKRIDLLATEISALRNEVRELKNSHSSALPGSRNEHADN